MKVLHINIHWKMQFSCLSFGHHMIFSPFALLLCLMLLLLVCSFQLMCTAKSCVQGETLFAQTQDADGKGSLLNRGPCVLFTVHVCLNESSYARLESELF